MKVFIYRSIGYLLGISLIVSGCSSTADTSISATESAAAGTLENPTTLQATATSAALASPSPEIMSSEAAIASPAWLSTPLTDVRSGEPFTIADFKGKVVLLENMAIWCTTCLRQQNQVLELHSLLDEGTDLVSLGIDIDPNEDADLLKGYIEEKGFTWKYAVAPIELTREIGQLYGAQFLNPPSVPMLIIDRNSQVHPLPFGVKDAEDLLQALQPYLSEGN